jgi:hypothetical protein
MLAGLPFAFGAPEILAGLLALPVIWWLLRLTPPRPQQETFPPLRILERIIRPEETPHQSPWWLTALRLLLAALVIMALAEPVLNPRDKAAIGSGPVALLIDNGWASVKDWERIRDTAVQITSDAGEADRPVAIAFSVAPEGQDAGPFDATQARERILAAEPQPLPDQRAKAVTALQAALATTPDASLFWLSNGVKSETDDSASALLANGTMTRIELLAPARLDLVGVTGVNNTATAFDVTLIRPDSEADPRSFTVAAYDTRGRRLAETVANFAEGEARHIAALEVPFELRNDFASIAIDNEASVAALRILDDSTRRRRIGLITGSDADQSQPLLSPLFYIRKALEPFSDLIEPQSADLIEAIPAILERKPAIIIMADVEFIPEDQLAGLTQWIQGGGTLVRFAGPRLASAIGERDEALLPVRLRVGERDLGGTLSWTEPQKVAAFPAQGPFAGLTPPREVTVVRQVLAEPDPSLTERTWAALEDGTPLVTGRKLGSGSLVLFHVTPQATWSNLPISGTFVDMLRRIIAISTNQGRITAGAQANAIALPPLRIADGMGRLGPPPPTAKPLAADAPDIAVTLDNPPGLYGTEDGARAVNLFAADATITPLDTTVLAAIATRQNYPDNSAQDLRPPLFLLALLLLAIDTVIVMVMSGSFAGFARRVRRNTPSASAATLLATVVLTAAVWPHPASAQQTPTPDLTLQNDARPDDAAAIAAISSTRIAYVITGNPSLDTISRAGLQGLSNYLSSRTALEPAEPVGVDLETDELTFYPLIYWPMDASSALPSPAAISRIDAYMREGGTVLFDTRDQLASGLGFGGSTTPESNHLRTILSSINVPPLEPVPDDHVLTKAFYILNEFPGRYRGGALWVEASLDADNSGARPVRTGDGVSPIMITSNDFAGSWAVDGAGNAMFPTVPADPIQRVWAYRTGVNIVMYMLTGNYKSDQVHVPALLERLGQ